MRKLLVAAALLLSFSSLAMAAKLKPLTVKSGSVQATVDGKVVTYSAGQTVPENAQLSATSDAVLESGGMVINAPAGSKFQTAMTDNGMIDVRANSGQLTVSGFGNTATIPAGGEANAGGNNIQAISGSIAVTTQIAGTTFHRTITNGQEMHGVGVITGGANNFLVYGLANATTIIPPPPPNPTQNNTVAPIVSPSSPS